MSFSTVKHPPAIESLSPDLQYQLWERNKRASRASWIWTVILAAPAVAFIAIEPINSTLTDAYRIADFFNLVSNDRVVMDVSELGLEPKQIENAAIIIQVGQELGASENDILIALMAASQESNLYNVDHGDDWWFQQNGWGEVSDSRGLFQQRDSWGSEQCRMSPECAAKLFYEALFAVPNRESMSLNDAAQAVQNSAFPDEYAKWENQARSLSQPDQPEVVEVVDPASNSDFQQGDRVGTFQVSRGVIPGEHDGVDVATPEGTPLFVFGQKDEAIDVECHSQTDTSGNYSGWGIYGTFYVPSVGKSFLVGHLSKCNPGTYQAGEVWGFSGNTGDSTGPHSHTEQTSGDAAGFAAQPEEPSRAAVEAIHGVFK